MIQTLGAFPNSKTFEAGAPYANPGRAHRRAKARLAARIAAYSAVSGKPGYRMPGSMKVRGN